MVRIASHRAAMSYSTQKRPFYVTTPLGDDALLLHRFDGEEALSRPFAFRLWMVSEDDAIDAKKIVGKRVTLWADAQNGNDEDGSCWSGIVASFGRAGSAWFAGAGDTQEMTAYEAEIVPWFWQLKLVHDCRIFQNLNIPDIVDTILDELKLGTHESDLTGNYPALDYCVQYNESSFDFIARLLEDAGIHYFFKHDPKKQEDILVISDHQEKDYKGNVTNLRYATNWADQDEPVVFSLARHQQMRSASVSMRDYNFIKPTQNLESSVDSVLDAGVVKGLNRYAYPGGYQEHADGDGRSKLAMEIEEAAHEQLEGASTHLDVRAGTAFELDDPPNDVLKPSWRVLSARHRGENNLDEDNGEAFYRNDFVVRPLATPFRPARTTPKPRMYGPQTAVVTGPSGEEIYTDKYGRVKVHFFWDHLGSADDKSTCWIRVSQAWAGRGWGTFFLPRIGMEVIVDFLHGDPDQPLVTGCVYNGDNMPPYGLPGEMTKSTIKSWSTKGGGGFNELRFEDKKGSEQLFINAQMDLDRRIGNDSREWVEQDRSLIVKRDRLEEVRRTHSLHIKKDRIAEINGDDHLKLDGKQAISIGGSLSMKVTGGVGESFQTHSEQVQSDYYLKAGSNVVIEAGTMLTLKVGGNFITISGAGITMVGSPTVMINSGGSPGVGEAASLVSPTKITDPAIADSAKPGEKMDASNQAASKSGKSVASSAPTHDANDPANKDKKHYLEVELLDDAGKPVPGEQVRVTLPDGLTVAEGTTDEKGLFKVTNIDPGQCKVTFPDLEKEAWTPA